MVDAAVCSGSLESAVDFFFLEIAAAAERTRVQNEASPKVRVKIYPSIRRKIEGKKPSIAKANVVAKTAQKSRHSRQDAAGQHAR